MQYQFREVPVADVVVGDRVRKQLDEIDRLAEAIDSTFLQQPIGVTPGLNLIWGHRRLEAVKRLGWETVPAVVVDAANPLALELMENTCRHELPISDRALAAAEVIRQMEERRGKPTSGKLIVANWPQLERGEKTREYAARLTGFRSASTLRRAIAVAESGDGDLIDCMDDGSASIAACAEAVDLGRDAQVGLVGLVRGGAGTHDVAQFLKDRRPVETLSPPANGKSGGGGGKGGGGRQPGASRTAEGDEAEDDEPAFAATPGELEREGDAWVPPPAIEGLQSDPAGLPIPGRLQETFAAVERFRELELYLRKAQMMIDAVASGPGGEQYVRQLLHKARKGDGDDLRHTCEHVANAINKVLAYRPHAASCPYCEHEGKRNPGCKACLGLGWVTKGTWDAAPEDYRLAIEEELGVAR